MTFPDLVDLPLAVIGHVDPCWQPRPLLEAPPLPVQAEDLGLAQVGQLGGEGVKEAAAGHQLGKKTLK